MALDVGAFQEWALDMLYKMLFPKIKQDFMCRQDCEAVHMSGNMLAGDSTVTHLTVSGGSSVYGDSLEQQYRLDVEEGNLSLETARTAGTTSGIED